MQTCQDNYSTVFSSFGEMQTYHQRLSKESQWRRCRVRDLTIEPLDSKSPLAEDLPAFAPGTSQEAVRDTVRGLGLAMRVEGNLYPMRDTAYKSLLDRAKLRGSVLPKLSRPKLARTLNDCLHVFTSDALVLIRDEKVAAAHSGEPADYAVLPADELLEVLQAKLDSRFPGNQFETGYWDHTLTSATWTLPGQKEELLRTYQQELAARGKTGVESRLTPAVQFLTSDIGVSSAKVIALLEGGKTPIHIGSCVAVDHRCWAKVEDFDKSLDQLFAQFQDSVGKLQKLLNVYLDYRLCGLENVDFYLADKIAQNQSLDPCAAERVDACLLQVLLTAEQQGHLCLDKRDFIQKALQLLQTEGITVDLAANCAARLVENRRLLTYHKWVYRWEAGCAERNLACRIAAMLPQPAAGDAGELSQQLLDVERELGIALNDQQRKAVLTAVASPLSIITGGPGTGKTTTQRALLALYRRRKPSGRVVCCAPTGRAARRMEESTGETAQTLHKAMQLSHLEDGTYCAPKMLEADLVLVDEVSMMDAFLAERLLEALPEGCQLVLIGDADQLPSVGPGVVLRELIASGQVPVVRLTKIYRQHAGSRIAINAALIRTGNLHLEYGSDFVFVESANLGASAGMMEELYLREVGLYGVDNVALLSPFRKKSETGVDALNPRLREWVNPKSPDKPEVPHGKRLFRLGDKVMQTKNYEEVSNGDIGTVTSITNTAEGPLVTVDFGDGRAVEYDSSKLELLDLAYATTIHKSQGAEYDSVIVSIQNAHAVMLTRPLLYTAITRAKKRVILVGERKALCMAIRRMDTDQRNTQLAAQILDQIHIQREEKEHGKLS